MVPNGVGTGRPAAKGLAPRTVWQSLQLPNAASTRPRLTKPASNDCGAGGSIAAIAGRQMTANAAAAAAKMNITMMLAIIRRDAIQIRNRLGRSGAGTTITHNPPYRFH